MGSWLLDAKASIIVTNPVCCLIVHPLFEYGQIIGRRTRAPGCDKVMRHNSGDSDSDRRFLLTIYLSDMIHQ
jgi:hypothetical protein